MEKIYLKTNNRQEIVDITSDIQEYISEKKVESGIIVVYSPHTTAGITVNENADPDVRKDITHFFNKLVPKSLEFEHLEGNSDSHIKGSIVNFSQTFIIENGKLQLGTWQSIFFMEFDGPRQREVYLKIIQQ
jgi:secondary thiamine-phosphate synthase enzyme